MIATSSFDLVAEVKLFLRSERPSFLGVHTAVKTRQSSVDR
jgi:hypothetical protein